MKTLNKISLLIITFFAIACSKNEDTPAPAPTPAPLSVAFEGINTTVTAIPDATAVPVDAPAGTPPTPNPIEIPITIDKEGVIADGSKISIELDLNHTWAGDLAVQVITPTGETFGLIKRIGSLVQYGTSGWGGSSTDFKAGNKLVFNSVFVTLIPTNDSSDIPAGNYKPTFGINIIPANVVEVPMATFFANKNIKGIWKIKVYDCGNEDTGAVLGWKIKFDTGALK